MIKTAFFIQARTGSSRLPNKVLLDFDSKNCILDIIIDKLKKKFADFPLYICTSTSSGDDDIEKFCKKKNVDFFRGSENNVLKRFVDAATVNQVDVVIRICADNPFLDLDFLTELLDYYYKYPASDYWSFKNDKNIPVIKTHFGFFAEVVTVNALKKVYKATTDKLFLEHVTNYIYSNNEFDCRLKSLPSFLSKRNDLRFTIDDEEDFKLLQLIYQYYKKVGYNLKETIFFVEKNDKILNTMIKNINKYSK